VIGFLRRLAPLRWWQHALKHNPEIRGHLRLEMRERGKLVGVREGDNIWTLTGREFIAELIAIKATNPSRTTFRDDRVGYIGLGSGSQSEVSNIESLVDPVPYKTNLFLAALNAPATFPTSGSTTTNTVARFMREFSTSEISLGYNVVLTEAGLFTDGNPDDDWNIDPDDFPVSWNDAAGRAPMAYKTFEPITKTTQFNLRAVWDVRVV